MMKCDLVIGLLAALVFAGQDAMAGTVTGNVEAKKAKYLSNTVVYLEGVPGEFPAPEEPVVMDQSKLTFVPHVLPVLRGRPRSRSSTSRGARP
jgi:hypothetical protein